MYKYEGARILFVEGVLAQNSNTMKLIKFLETNQRSYTQIKAVTLNMHHEKKKL
jgi:hypothetical protein